VQFPELVLDLGLGLARDLAPQPLAARVEAETDRAVPAALALVPVDRVSLIMGFELGFLGAAYRNRTDDLFITSESLYRLS
jgi:hypothetical protein